MTPRVLFLAQHTEPVTERIPPHGSGAHVAATLAGLRASFDVLPLFGRDAGDAPARHPASRRLRKVLPSRIRGLRQDVLELIADRAFSTRALASAHAFRPDLVYGRSEYLATAPIRVARALGVPLVLEVNGLLEMDARTMYRSAAEPFGARIERRKLAAPDAIVTVSHGLADRLVARGANRETTFVVPNAVPDERVVAAPHVSGSSCVVGWVGHLMSWHADALLLLADIAPTVVERVPEVRFRIVGDGPRLTEIRERVSERGVDDAFEFVGAVPYDEVPQAVAGFDVGVIPDVFDYAFPVKLVEMGAAGIAVAAPRSDELDAMLRPGVEYQPFLRHDREALAAAIVVLLTEPGRRDALAASLHAAVRDRFTWTAAAGGLQTAVMAALACGVS